MKVFGYRIIVQKESKLVKNRPTAKTYKTWTRKGICPGCNVKTRSKHSIGCAWRYNMVKERY